MADVIYVELMNDNGVCKVQHLIAVKNDEHNIGTWELAPLRRSALPGTVVMPWSDDITTDVPDTLYNGCRARATVKFGCITILEILHRK
jgi:hypothetical protein